MTEKILKPTRANAGIEASYRAMLDKWIDAMHGSVSYWLLAAYRANPPAMAMDASSADNLTRVMRNLARRWIRQFDEASVKMADLFAGGVTKYTEASAKMILRDAGFSIPFKPTEVMQDAYDSVRNENVNLIKSIPQKYLTDVEGAVMRSVQSGRDLGALADDLQKIHNVTRNRAAFIARDQNNKATAVMTKARRLSLGITEAIWVHSGGGVHPRPGHVKAGADKRRYNITEGCEIDGEFIMPGELPNCRCVSRPVIKGFS